MRRPVTLAFACIFAFSSHALAAPTTADAPETAAGDPDKIICKKFTQIGSLVSTYRTCKTKREWARERENLRQVNISDSCATRGQMGGSVTPVPGQGNTFDC